MYFISNRIVSWRTVLIMVFCGTLGFIVSHTKLLATPPGTEGELSPAQLATLRGAVGAALPAALASVAASGPLLLGRSVRWGCDMSTVEARAASARATALLPMHTAGFDQRIDMVRWVAGTLGYTGAAVELGVKQGNFAEEVLTAWPGVSAYYLIDPWVHQADYADIANVPDAQHNEFLAETLARTAQFGAKVHTVRKFSFDAAADFADCSLDFVYVDAVHDYEGALRDILDWWPKLKPGGIMSGHDYLDQIHVVGVFGVKSAADRFAVAVDRQIYGTNIVNWGSFLIIK